MTMETKEGGVELMSVVLVVLPATGADNGPAERDPAGYSELLSSLAGSTNLNSIVQLRPFQYSVASSIARAPVSNEPQPIPIDHCCPAIN